MTTFCNNFPLKNLTTFKIGGEAKYFIEANSADQLREALEFVQKSKINVFILGGGSNILVSDAGFDGLVIQIRNQGFWVEKEDEAETIIKIAGGEVWDTVVERAVEHGWWGIENLSHIPGLSGALAVQNVGAYGCEAKDVIIKVGVFDRKTGDTKTLSNAECGFGYRKSVFNATERGRFAALEVYLRLSKRPKPILGYPDVKKFFFEKGIANPSLGEIRQAIIAIRDRKFPFPKEAAGGNAGSFFKNVFLSLTEYQNFERKAQENFDQAALERLRVQKNKFPQGDEIKIPSAFLIDICGLKGKSIGGARVSETQPNVLLNFSGTASAGEVLTLAREVRKLVRQKTGLILELEPELVGFTAAEAESYLKL